MPNKNNLWKKIKYVITAQQSENNGSKSGLLVVL